MAEREQARRIAARWTALALSTYGDWGRYKRADVCRLSFVLQIYQELARIITTKN
jgi:hypothetical protein